MAVRKSNFNLNLVWLHCPSSPILTIRSNIPRLLKEFMEFMLYDLPYLGMTLGEPIMLKLGVHLQTPMYIFPV